MPTSDDYRAMAEECFQWARDARTEDVRLVYLGLAQTWLEAAYFGDHSLPVRLPPTLNQQQR